MKNRSILARINAKKSKKKGGKKATVETPSPKVIAQIKGLNPETGEVEVVLNSWEEAEAQELHATNIKSAIKTGNKYKGRLWEISE
jgi:hypothetical protein